MADIDAAKNDSLLNGLVVEPIGIESSEVFAGQFCGCSDFIFIKIIDGFEDLLSCCKKDEQLFNINFHINRITYQLQHNALKWVKKHELFPILINNPRYKIFDVDHTPDPEDFTLR